MGKLARRADNLTVTWFTTAFLLSQRMLTFIQHFQYYMAVKVIEPTWLQFFNQLNKLSNLDALLDAHLHCLEVCMDNCLLTSPDLMSLFGKLCVVCVLFANFVQHVIASSTDGLNFGAMSGAGDTLSRPRDSSPANSSIWSVDGVPRVRSTAPSTVSGDTVLTKVTREDYGRLSSTEAFAQKVIDFDQKFNGLLVEFIDKIRHYSKEREELTSLVSRLDFNDFYTLYSNAPTASGFNDNLGIYAGPTESYVDQRQQSTDIDPTVADYMPRISKPRTRKPGPVPPPASLPPSYPTSDAHFSDDPEDDYI
ncbi:unnamed protein product [Echinostoma caproni]|uniref:Gamma-tubulin complex component n=1 Tax=Echinostoma caproni TaxID=27848 RepID=A0A3P8H8Q1_9TREM|nr:unnamed protein product [Echinostoma caproni]